VLDLAFVKKEKDGGIVGLNLGDLDLDGIPELVAFEGAPSGLLGKDDVEEAGNAIEDPGVLTQAEFDTEKAKLLAT
jgi:hypothetical protein